MADDDRDAIVCLRVADCDTPFPGSTREHYCMECAEEVWMSRNALEFWENSPGIRTICAPCAVEGEPDRIEAVPGDRLGEQMVKRLPMKRILKWLYGRDPA